MRAFGRAVCGRMPLRCWRSPAAARRPPPPRRWATRSRWPTRPIRPCRPSAPSCGPPTRNMCRPRPACGPPSASAAPHQYEQRADRTPPGWRSRRDARRRRPAAASCTVNQPLYTGGPGHRRRSTPPRPTSWPAARACAAPRSACCRAWSAPISTCAATRSSWRSRRTMSTCWRASSRRPSAQFDAGELTRTDVAQSQARLAQARSQLATAQSTLASRPGGLRRGGRAEPRRTGAGAADRAAAAGRRSTPPSTRPSATIRSCARPTMPSRPAPRAWPRPRRQTRPDRLGAGPVRLRRRSCIGAGVGPQRPFAGERGRRRASAPAPTCRCSPAA